MLDRRFEEMSIQPDGRPQFLREEQSTVLPPFYAVAAVAGRAEGVPVVARPRNYFGPVPSYHGQPPQHPLVPTPDAFMPYRQTYAHASIESVPSTAHLSPRIAYNAYTNEASSVSSMSRESSIYPTPEGSMSSPANAARLTRNTRQKRGSESQESDSGRSFKRASRASPQSDLSDDEDQMCDTCRVPFAECSDRKEHVRKGKKIAKEKSSRNDQARVFQNMEDLLEFGLNWRSPKAQMPGNEKKSGLRRDKQHIFVATNTVADLAMRWIARRGDFDAFLEESRPVLDSHITNSSSQDLHAGSLLAPSSPSDKRRCTDDPDHISCGDPIECRKTIRGMHCRENLGRILKVPAANVHSRSSRAGARSKAFLPRKH